MNIKLKVLDQMADIEYVNVKLFFLFFLIFFYFYFFPFLYTTRRYQLTAGANEKIQLASFVATFQDARNHA